MVAEFQLNLAINSMLIEPSGHEVGDRRVPLFPMLDVPFLCKGLVDVDGTNTPILWNEVGNRLSRESVVAGDHEKKHCGSEEKEYIIHSKPLWRRQ